VARESKILLISEHPEEGWGGPVHYLATLIPVLYREGYRICLLPDGGVSEELQARLRENQVQLISRHDGLLWVRRLFRKFPRVMRYPLESLVINMWIKSKRIEPDRVIVSLCSPGRYLFPYGLLSQAMFVFHSEPSGSRHTKAARIFKFLAGKKATFVGVSDWVTKSLKDVWRVDENRIKLVTIKNPATQEVAPVPYIPEERRLILMVGAANEYKNPWFWLKVAQLVVEKNTQEAVTFRWVGDGPLLPAMRKWVAERNLSDMIELPGYSDELEKHYEEARIYFQCSVRETSSFSAIDALGFGLPLFMSISGGLRELMEEIGIEMAVDLSSESKTAELLNSLLRDFERLEALSKKSKEVARIQYSFTRWEEAILEQL